jgi:CAP-Gly domain-containing linker protein 1
LRYIGDIEGKPGLWAGVELNGGFTGKGKNDGSVAGYDQCCTPCSFRQILTLSLLSRKQYFSCPEKCGVFVATTKLSPPTVGSGAFQSQRPTSVASSRSGRTTPAMTGRMTPSYSMPRTPSASFSNGRVTPSSLVGRSTPGITKRIYKTPTAKPPNGASLTDKITAGSRAAKYMNMTAQQLNSRDLGDRAESPTRKSNGVFKPGVPSPTISRTLSSPSRPPGSPFSTPRAGSGRFTGIVGPTTSPSLPSSLSRTSVSTPRPRVLSSVAMPPPPSPRMSQQLITDLTTGDDATLNAEARSRPPVRLHSRPSSSISFRSNGTDEVGLVEQLQSRLDAMEYENERLRTASTPEPATDPDQLKQMQLEKLKALARASELEAKLAEVEQDFNSRGVRLQTLETQNSELTTRLNEAETEARDSTATYKQDAETYHSTIKSLQDRVQELEGLNTQKDDTIQGHTSDITTLKDDLERARVELEEEKKELGLQIDELRIAGQVGHV